MLRTEQIGDTYVLNYRYDDNGTLVSVSSYNISTEAVNILYAQTNTRGDVVALYNGDGNVKTVYTYDSWGKLVSVTDGEGNALGANKLGNLNSIRYRGYVYDSETGLYYLQSRYYDPEVGRFLNADSVDYIGYSDSVISYNVFAYCENNAVNYADPFGTRYIEHACCVDGRCSRCVAAKNQSISSVRIKESDLNIYTPKKGSYKEGKINICIDKDYIDKKGTEDTSDDEKNPNIKIYNSYKITQETDMYFVLDRIMDSSYFDESVFTRTEDSYFVEWYGHNFVYAVTYLLVYIGFRSFAGFNERAKHVDLDENEDVWIWYALYAYLMNAETK